MFIFLVVSSVCCCKYSVSFQASNLYLSHHIKTRTHTDTYIGVWRKWLFVITAPPLCLSSSLRGGVASWRALALLSWLTVCWWHWLTLEKDKDTNTSMNTQTRTNTTPVKAGDESQSEDIERHIEQTHKTHPHPPMYRLWCEEICTHNHCIHKLR